MHAFSPAIFMTRINEDNKQIRLSSQCAIGLLFAIVLMVVSPTLAQPGQFTSRGDKTRSASNTQEYLLTPSNVNKNNFGHLFSVPIDYQALAQPLYVPGVTINAGPYAGTVHNVVYVATQSDMVYAIDADAGTILWQQSEVIAGGTTASGSYLPCGKLGGFTQEGIAGTPVIDPSAGPGTMYLVAKSVFNGAVYHYLHAIDITTGADLVPPTQLAANSVSLKNTQKSFTSLHQKNRPGLLLLNGVLYLGFGSNGCNDSNTGWVLAYDANPGDGNYLQQLGAFNTSPDIGLTSIWQTGSGLAGDEEGNIFASTAESTNYDVPNGGQSYSDSVLKLTAPPWAAQNVSEPNSQPNQYFTPAAVSYLNSHDQDVSSVGPIILPDQSPKPVACTQDPCHMLVASGKNKQVYVLDRDAMGGWWSNPGCLPPQNCDPQILQEFTLTGGAGELMASPAYWNGIVYFAPDGAPIQAFQVTSGTPPLAPLTQTSKKYVGAHAPSVSSNGNTNGILWIISGNSLYAFDALTLDVLYASNQTGGRDTFPKVAHFATQTVANGRVYIATQTSLEVFGLFHIMSVAGGNNQSATVLTSLPQPLQISTADPYNGQPIAGVTVNFSDGNKGGTFNPPSATTDGDGNASTTYTFPKKSGPYTLTASAANFGSVIATETATPGPVAKLISYSGARQTGVVGTVLPNALTAQARDAYSNPVPGLSVTFASNQGGVLTPSSATTNASGLAAATFQLPTTPVKSTVTAGAMGLKNASFVEFSVAGAAATVAVVSGNNQSAPAGTTLPASLTVLVTDQYGNPISGASVTFDDGGAGGTFLGANPGTTGSNGTFAEAYMLPPSEGVITITATVPGVSNPAVFTETSN
ncbi:MAG TPA: Ig-like domain-containing protein [Terriglobales bacterium]|nr:Ig-like domain-containing protein [Terriglobales bacterium]